MGLLSEPESLFEFKNPPALFRLHAVRSNSRSTSYRPLLLLAFFDFPVALMGLRTITGLEVTESPADPRVVFGVKVLR